jgi:hypothetical protein
MPLDLPINGGHVLPGGLFLLEGVCAAGLVKDLQQDSHIAPIS